MLEKTDTKQGARFRKGQSGNPSGRPRGARNKTTLAVEALLDGEAEVLTRKAIERAKDGDSVALRLCLERILPPRKDRPVSFALPKIESAADAGKGEHSDFNRGCDWGRDASGSRGGPEAPGRSREGS